MHPNEIKKNLSSGFTPDKMSIALFKYLKDNAMEDILYWQKLQLFGGYPVSTDNELLGTYTRNQRSRGKVRGQPYKMVNTGELKSRMRVVINVSKREITFKNSRPGHDNNKSESSGYGPIDSDDTSLFRFNTDIFASANWFGLTPTNFQKLIDRYCQPFIYEWTKSKIYGKTKV